MHTAAVIGIGDISGIHLAAIAANPEIELAAVCDIDAARADQAATQWQVPAFTDYTTMLAEIAPQVVHITLPHYLHAPVGIDALLSGSHVLTEKPLADNLSAAAEFAAVAASAGPRVGVCFQNRYNPTSVALHDAVDSGRYGAPLGARASVWWDRQPGYYQAAPWRARWDTAGGGVLINQTIHTIDLLTWLLGTPDVVSGQAANLSHRDVIEVEDTATVTMRHPNQVSSTYFATNSHITNAPVELELTFEEAVLRMHDNVLDRVGSNIEQLACDEPAGGGRSYWGASHAKLIDDFYASLAGPDPFWIDANAAMVSLTVLRQVYEQSSLVSRA